MTEGGEDGGQRDQREGGRGNGGGLGGGNPALRESAPRSGACDWPSVAIVAGAAFTGTHCSSCGGGGAGGGAVLLVRIVHVRPESCLQVSLNGAKDKQKKVCCACVCDFSAPFYRFALEEVIWTQRYLHRSRNGAEDRQKKTGMLRIAANEQADALQEESEEAMDRR